MSPAEPDTDILLARVAAGDADARGPLLDRHRERLRSLVALRLDRRLAAREDPSDVVQEALTDAAGRLDAYLEDRAVPFYVWLRALALERLIDLHRRHLSKKRHPRREEACVAYLADDSLTQLTNRMIDQASGPDASLDRAELRGRLLAALAGLSERDREVLAMRHLEQLSVAQIAAALGITEGAVKVRHLRALERLRLSAGEAFREDVP